MSKIKNIIVIGSGVMGAGIAGHIATAGFKVLLLDIAHTGCDRNILAKNGIKKSLSLKEENIIPGNLEDNLSSLESADWVIEAITEKLELKKNLYNILEKHCHKNCIFSSNTSTILLKQLIEETNENFQNNFLITHFFNPPRYMNLVEIVAGEHTKQNIVKLIVEFIDIHLGKTIVKSNDSPGFIANRIGCYLLEAALSCAIESDTSIQEIDSILSQAMNIPKTGIFGLYDLIGLDTMQLISHSLRTNLTELDDFHNVSKSHPLVIEMINQGYTGRKGKGGFYRLKTDVNGIKYKEVINLKTGDYQKEKDNQKFNVSLNDLILSNPYFRKILLKFFNYTANIIPSACENICEIDQAMKCGYNWKLGPFELIDKIGIGFLKEELHKEKITIAKILESCTSNFYNNNQYFNGNVYQNIANPSGIILLNNKQIIEKNQSAHIINLQDDVAVIEISSRVPVMDHNFFHLVLRFFNIYAKDFRCLILTGDNFAVGGDLKFMLEMVSKGDFQALDEYLILGQKVMLSLKYSPITLISALRGMALGGGSELLLHSHAVVSHVESNSGLVESGVGLIPAWGGCKELILRSDNEKDLINSFKTILHGKISLSAFQLKEMLKIKQFKIIMNARRLLSESKNLKLEKPEIHKNKNKIIQVNWLEIIKEMNLNGYNKVIAEKLIDIFVSLPEEDKLLNKEREIFLSLLKNQETKDRIHHMLVTGKRL
jgi:3-hydroxyacyl-CoA dehydrogenase